MMAADSNHRDLLHSNRQLGPLPMHRLRRVEKPTTVVTDEIERVNGADNPLDMARRGAYGPAVQTAAEPFLPDRHPVSAALHDAVVRIATVREDEVAAVKAPISDDLRVLSRHIKRLGYFLGADVMGICRVPQSAVYTHDFGGKPVEIEFRYAIVLVMRKEYRSVQASTGTDWFGDPLSFQAYLRLGIATEVMASYVKRLGYPASPQSTIGRGKPGYQVLIPPLLLWAGVGEVSRVGVVLNPFLGLSYKAAAVLTDMPLEPDKPIDFGLQDFCQHCQICADNCPVGAISTGNKVMYNGYETWKVNEKRCATFSVTNKRGSICNTCVKVCPWTRPNTRPHDAVRWAVQRSAVARRLAIRASSTNRRTKAQADEKWWFDVHYQDGVLSDAPERKW
jgi:reductive dehalogenase